MTNTGITRPVRMDKDQTLSEYTFGLGTFIVLFFVYAAAQTNIHLLWISGIMLTAFTLLNAYERSKPNNYAHFLVHAPVLAIGVIWYAAVVLTLHTGQQIYGMWAALLALGAMYIVTINALIIANLQPDKTIRTLLQKKLITVSDEKVYFALPYKLDRDAGLPDWLYTAICAGRIFWIIVMAIGVIFFVPGVYSSINVGERLVSSFGTLGLGFAVLGTRLWQIPLFLGIQRKFESNHLPEELSGTI